MGPEQRTHRSIAGQDGAACRGAVRVLGIPRSVSHVFPACPRAATLPPQAVERGAVEALPDRGMGMAGREEDPRLRHLRLGSLSTEDDTERISELIPSVRLVEDREITTPDHLALFEVGDVPGG